MITEQLKRSLQYLVLLGTVLLLLTACNKSLPLYAEMREIDDSGWSQDGIAVFEVPIRDSIQAYGMATLFRIHSDKAPSQFSLILKVIAPSGAWFCDTLSFNVSPRPELWNDYKYPYCKHIRFNQKGIWIFTLQPLADERKIMELRSIGISIEKASDE